VPGSPRVPSQGKGITSHTITVFRIDAATGALSLASSKNLGAGHEPNYLVAVGP
jgi:hypothetical protein